MKLWSIGCKWGVYMFYGWNFFFKLLVKLSRVLRRFKGSLKETLHYFYLFFVLWTYIYLCIWSFLLNLRWLWSKFDFQVDLGLISGQSVSCLGLELFCVVRWKQTQISMTSSARWWILVGRQRGGIVTRVTTSRYTCPLLAWLSRGIKGSRRADAG